MPVVTVYESALFILTDFLDVTMYILVHSCSL